MRLFAPVLLAALLGSASIAGAAMTDAECEAAWKKADTNNDGTLNEAEAASFYAAVRVAGKSVEDGKFARADFITHCKAGVFDVATRANDPGAPLEGANSFTENQARDRALAAGFGNVSPLKKDDKGIWRGTGTRGSQNVSIAVDFKGNVVAN